MTADPIEPGPWSVRSTDDGSPTLFHSGVGQACHSTAGAWREARDTYAAGARLRERAQGGEWSTCRLLDVATGMGWNLAAALEALDGTGCTLEAVALECDLRVLQHGVRLARSATAGDYPWWELVAEAIADAIGDSEAGLPGEPQHWRRVPFAGGRGGLRLALGAGSRTLAQLASAEPELAFDAVFLDPFSPAVEAELWEQPFMDQLAACMAPGSLLMTYCAASRVRLRMALAGLRVGRGPGIGNKAEGTLASPDAQLPPLPARAAANLARALLGQDQGLRAEDGGG